MILVDAATNAATAGAGTDSLIESLGPYAAAGAFALAAVGWLIKDRWRVIQDRNAERAATKEQSERLIEQAHQLVPVLDRTTAALEQATRVMERLERDR